MELKKIILRILIMALFLAALMFTIRFFTNLFTNSAHPLHGDGHTIRKEILIEAPFTSIKLKGSLHAFIRQHSVAGIEITGDSNLLQHLVFDFSDDELIIRQTRNFHLTEPVKLMISMPDLRKISAEGASEIEIKDTLRADEFSIKIEGAAMARLTLNCASFKSEISGAGEIILTGRASQSEHVINGAGKLSAEEMLVVHQKVKINGAGKAKVTAKETLDATINGAGIIEYSGDPSITEKINGIGKIKRKSHED